MKIKPVSGYTLVEVRTVGDSMLVTTTGETIGERENVVVAVSKKDELEWKVGDVVSIGEGTGGFNMEEKGKKYILLPNSSVIAVL